MTHTNGFVLSADENAQHRRVAIIDGNEFAVQPIEQYNLWEVKPIGKSQIATPVELRGTFTSPNEAFKAVSKYNARASLKPKKLPLTDAPTKE